MTNWTRAVTHPLGLTAFALALLFGLLSTFSARPWVLPVCVSLAAITLLAGLGLAFRQVRETSSTRQKGKIEAPVNRADVGGTGNIVVQDSAGPVNINSAVHNGQKTL